MGDFLKLVHKRISFLETKKVFFKKNLNQPSTVSCQGRRAYNKWYAPLVVHVLVLKKSGFSPFNCLHVHV